MATGDLLNLYGFPMTGRRWSGGAWARIPPDGRVRPTGQHTRSFLSELLDCSTLGGASCNDSLMSVRNPAASRRTDQGLKVIAPQALAYTGRYFGLLDATADRL